MPSEYENEQIKLIDEWKKQVPSVVAKSVSLFAKPAVWLIQKIIPQSVFKAALNAANSAGKMFADESDILRDGEVTDIKDLRHESLEKCDQLADDVHNWAIGIAGTEGGITGTMGLPGMLLDIPSVLMLSLRTIHKIGLCYGYRADSKQERDFVLGILSAAGSNSQKEKNQALLVLRSIEVIVQKQTWKAINDKASQSLGKEAGIIAIKNLCKQLGINLTKRKVSQVLPVIGGGIGAAINADFIRDVGYAARRVYQERWLVDNGKWKEE